MGQLIAPFRPNRYRTSNLHNRVEPQCGCESTIDRWERELGHGSPRVVDRSRGLTEYQKDQQKHRSGMLARNAVEIIRARRLWRVKQAERLAEMQQRELLEAGPQNLA